MLAMQIDKADLVQRLVAALVGEMPASAPAATAPAATAPAPAKPPKGGRGQKRGTAPGKEHAPPYQAAIEEVFGMAGTSKGSGGKSSSGEVSKKARK